MTSGSEARSPDNVASSSWSLLRTRSATSRGVSTAAASSLGVFPASGSPRSRFIACKKSTSLGLACRVPPSLRNKAASRSDTLRCTDATASEVMMDGADGVGRSQDTVNVVLWSSAWQPPRIGASRLVGKLTAVTSTCPMRQSNSKDSGPS